MTRWLGLGAWWLLCVALPCAGARAELPVPALSARVTDLAGVLGEADRAALEQRLADFEQAKGAQVAVLVVPSTDGEPIEQFALRVAEAWRLGRAGVDDGALLVVAIEDRRIRVEVGYGLEGALTDATANRIIEEFMVPQMRAGDYAAGVRIGVEHMLDVIAGEPLPPPARPEPGADAAENPYLFALFSAFFFALFFHRRTRRRRPGRALLGGGVAGLLTLWLTGVLVAAGVAAVAGFVLGLLLNQLGPPGGWASHGRHGGYFPGGWYPGGGGGGFGGGGASGGW